MKRIWEAGKHCYLPVLKEGKTLKFVRYHENDNLAKNEHGIFEPVGDLPCINTERLQLILMPLLAFDARGRRLGTGGGYYDRTLAFMFEKRVSQARPHLTGVAFSGQHCDRLPEDPWDIRLDSLITEQGLRFFK